MIIPAYSAFAGSITLTTYYPAPVGAYSQTKLSTNYTVPTTTAGTYCTAANSGKIYIDIGTQTENQCTGVGIANTIAGTFCAAGSSALFTNSANVLYQCTGTAGASSLFCTAGNAGAIIADSSGTLHACIKNPNTGAYQDTIYPQQCYNTFCSYDNSTDQNNNACSNFRASPCPTGFLQTNVDAQGDPIDAMNTADNSTLLSAVCCSPGAINNTSNPSSTVLVTTGSGITAQLVDSTKGDTPLNVPGLTISSITGTRLASPSCNLSINPGATTFSIYSSSPCFLIGGTYKLVISLVGGYTITYYLNLNSGVYNYTTLNIPINPSTL